jgi:hypothetical protein
MFTRLIDNQQDGQGGPGKKQEVKLENGSAAAGANNGGKKKCC